MEKEPIPLENGTRYNNLAEFCTALKICKKDIYGYIYANDCSVSEAATVLGKKYESKERCYKGLGITKKSVQNHMKKTSCMFEEAVVYCYEKKLEKQFEFRREIYKSYNACCTAYNLAQEYVAIKAKREKITRQEAMEKLLAQRESEKTI